MINRTLRVVEIAHDICGKQAGQLARRAEALLDPKRADSLGCIVADFDRQKQAINAEPYSDDKRSRIRAAADAALGKMAGITGQLATLEAEHGRQYTDGDEIALSAVRDAARRVTTDLQAA